MTASEFVELVFHVREMADELADVPAEVQHDGEGREREGPQSHERQRVLRRGLRDKDGIGTDHDSRYG